MKLLKENQVILSDVVVATSFTKRLRGYMFYKSPPSEGLVIKPCSSIHTFFMKFDIDVLFLDDHMMVVKKIEGLKKSQMIPPVKSAIYTIESSVGKFDDVKVGDYLTLC